MTPAERELLNVVSATLIAITRAGAIGARFNGTEADVAASLLQRAAQAVEAAARPLPLTPRPKYVRIERADNRSLNCMSCGDDREWLVRVGEHYDPSALLCPTCIREASALLETMT